MNFTPLCCRMKPNCTTCCSARSLKRFWKSHAIRSISEPRLASLAFFIRGDKTCCVIPGGGIAPDHLQWIHPPYPFFLPVKVLGKVFRGKFVYGLRRAFRSERLMFAGQIQRLSEPKAFAAFLRTLFRHDWVVYAKP